MTRASQRRSPSCKPPLSRADARRVERDVPRRRVRAAASRQPANEWDGESPSSTRAIVVVVVRSVARRAGWSRASSRRVVVSRGFASARSRVAHSRVRSGPFPQCAAPGCGRGRGRDRDRATTRETRLARVVALALGRGRAIARAAARPRSTTVEVRFFIFIFLVVVATTTTTAGWTRWTTTSATRLEISLARGRGRTRGGGGGDSKTTATRGGETVVGGETRGDARGRR